MGRRKKPAGEYQLSNGRRQVIVDSPGKRITEIFNKAGDRIERTEAYKRYSDEDEVHNDDKLKEMCEKKTPPGIRTNPIPGLPGRIKKDERLGVEFHSPGQFDSYMEKNGLVEMDRGELSTPSEAELPRRKPGTTTHGMVKSIVFDNEDSMSGRVEPLKGQDDAWSNTLKLKQRKKHLKAKRDNQVDKKAIRRNIREKYGV